MGLPGIQHASRTPSCGVCGKSMGVRPGWWGTLPGNPGSRPGNSDGLRVPDHPHPRERARGGHCPAGPSQKTPILHVCVCLSVCLSSPRGPWSPRCPDPPYPQQQVLRDTRPTATETSGAPALPGLSHQGAAWLVEAPAPGGPPAEVGTPWLITPTTHSASAADPSLPAEDCRGAEPPFPGRCHSCKRNLTM